MNTRRNIAAEEFTTDCMRLMAGWVLSFISLLSICLILWA